MASHTINHNIIIGDLMQSKKVTYSLPIEPRPDGLNEVCRTQLFN